MPAQPKVPAQPKIPGQSSSLKRESRNFIGQRGGLDALGFCRPNNATPSFLGGAICVICLVSLERERCCDGVGEKKADDLRKIVVGHYIAVQQ
jgi:hypothetical protein